MRISAIRIRSPMKGGGIALLAGTATNQDGVVAAMTTGKIMLFNEPCSLD